MALLMVAATGFSAFATWQTARVTNRLFTVAERPYVGVERIAFDVVDGSSVRLVIDTRNFGTVSGHSGVAHFRLLLDGKPLSDAGLGDTIVNIGIFTQTVSHTLNLFVAKDVYVQARAGRSRFDVDMHITYRGPDERAFCYNETMTYDSRADAFDPSGGRGLCDGETY